MNTSTRYKGRPERAEATAPTGVGLAVIGQGYVGLPLAIRAAEMGFNVIGVESNPTRENLLRGGQTFTDDVAAERIGAMIDNGRYRVSSSYSDVDGFETAVISVPTPLKGVAPDLSAVEQSSASLAPFVREGSLVILESTTYPGTTEDVVVPILEHGSGLRAGADFSVGYSPERIDPGNSVWNFANTPKLVAGIDDESLRRTRAFFDRIVETTVPVKGTREAELAKLIENTYRAVNIALVNELAMVASDAGINIWESLQAAASKPFGFAQFSPGPGIGGHCLPIDPIYLDWFARQFTGRSLDTVQSAMQLNRSMPAYVAARASRMLELDGLRTNDSRILLLGLAYKASSADTRESPAFAVARSLRDLGADVIASDPYVSELDAGEIPLMPFDTRTVRGVDLVILCTGHPEFEDAEVVACAPRLLDTRNFYDLGMGEKL